MRSKGQPSSFRNISIYVLQCHAKATNVWYNCVDSDLDTMVAKPLNTVLKRSYMFMLDKAIYEFIVLDLAIKLPLDPPLTSVPSR
jgi:hypothetical protein